MKSKKKQVKQVALESEVVADLEPGDEETEAIKGGGLSRIGQCPTATTR